MWSIFWDFDICEMELSKKMSTEYIYFKLELSN